MRVPIHIVSLRRFFGVSLILLTAASGYARGPQPALRIPLAPLGFQTLTQEFLLDGSSMLTLHFVDDKHLLVTFNVRTLLKRIPNDPPDDQDRNVAAILLELPSGRILARTEWRLHDHGQYLWKLGHGRFLLRIRDTLTTINPLANLSTPDPFRQRPFLNVMGRRIGALLLTPDADLLTVETRDAAPPHPTQVADAEPDSSHPTDPPPVQINFYRLSYPADEADGVLLHSAGGGLSKGFGSIALTAAGHLSLIDQGHQSWAFNFDTFSGQTRELSPFDSTCRPSPVFVSGSEFIAFGCHGSQGPQVLGGFNMRGEEMWEQGLYGDSTAPYIVFSPASGRFALGRVMSSTPISDGQAILPEAIASQNVIVYQIDSGKQILKLDCAPIERAGQNFAISPDGLSFGVIHADAIEIYDLPPLTTQEQAAIKLDQAAAPQETDQPVHFTAGSSSPENQTETQPANQTATQSETQSQPATQPATAPPNPSAQAAGSAKPPASPAPSTTTPARQPAPAQNASGDQQPEQPRKPPTLYTLPTDSQSSQSNGQPK